jgi:hypothetical protein
VALEVSRIVLSRLSIIDWVIIIIVIIIIIIIVVVLLLLLLYCIYDVLCL